MPAVLEDVKSAAATLTVEEQLELIEYLEIATLDIRAEWSAIASRRLVEHRAGLRQAVPFDTVFKRLSVD